MTRKMKLTEERAKRLNDAAYERLVNNLIRYGNNPSTKQKTALKSLIETFTAIARGEKTGRIAFPLQTGLGKTQSIIAFVAILVEQGFTDVSVVICASKIEALCDLQRALVKEGVPPEMIGFLHSYRFDQKKAERYLKERQELPQGFASLPSTKDNSSKPILLVTHKRIKGSEDVEDTISFDGGTRDLMIWDESLIASESFSVSFLDVAKAINYLETPEVKKTDDQKKALAYLNYVKALIAAEIERQKDLEARPQVIHFPHLHEHEIELFKTEIDKIDNNVFVVEPLKVLLEMSQNPLRVLTDIEQGDGIITYDTVIPKDILNIVILDASHLIRDLARLDATISVAHIEPDIISYENVTVHQLAFASGRRSMTKEFGRKRGQRSISKEIIDVIREIPSDQGIIVVTFKQRGGMNFTRTLKEDIEDAGIDLKAMINVTMGKTSESTEEISKPRIVFLTWGNECSLNELSYCSNVIFAGVLHRSHIDIGSAILGQKDDLCMALRNSEIKQVIQSEIAHSVYQAMSRGRSRIIDGSVTKPMEVWLIHKTNLNPLIEKVMPGIKWKEWIPKHLPLSETKIDRLKEVILDRLSSISDSVFQLSVRELKKMLNLTDVPPNSFTSGLKKAVSSLPSWRIQGRSLVRGPYPFFCERSS